MKELPAIGSTACIKNGWDCFVEVTIIAHYKDKAVYIYTQNDRERVDMAVAGRFHELTDEVRKIIQFTNLGVSFEQAKKILEMLKQSPALTTTESCQPTNHNYVNAGHSAGGMNFMCTKCGHTKEVR